MRISIWIGWLIPSLAATAQAGVPIQGRVFDGEATLRVLFDARQKGQNFDPALKVPVSGKEISILVYEGLNDKSPQAAPNRTWKATSDAAGAIQLDTGLEKWPQGAYFVARCELEGSVVYSPFLQPSAAGTDIHLYPTTDDAQQMNVKAQVAYDVFGTGGQKSIRVRFGLRILNQSGALYVGQRTLSGAREIWRIPLPEDAKIIVNTGPYKDIPGWKTTLDGHHLVLDVPIPSVLDFDLQKDFWEVHYVIPARQRLVQSFSIPVNLEKQSFLVWCTHEAMSLDSRQLEGRHSELLPDPFTGEKRNQDVIFSTDPTQAGTQATVVLTVDNVAVGQLISTRAATWVGGFVMVCVLGILLGLALGPRELTADALLAGLSGEEVLDRLAQLDLRRSRGELSDKEHQRLREPLLELAMEESTGGTASSGGPPPLPSTNLDGVRPILEQIDRLEKGGLKDPARISERAHLLEALAKALKGEGQRG